MNTIINHIFCLKEFSLFSELFLSCSVLQLTFYAVSTTYNRKFNFVILSSSFFYIASLILWLSLILLLNEDLLIVNSYISNNSIINDYLSFSIKSVICVFSILFLIFVNTAVKEEEPLKNHFEYVVLIMLSILGLLILCSANDLITAYLAVELQSVAFYIMAAFKKNSTYSVESSLKYFIVGSLASAFFLFGSSLLYGCLGSLNFDDFRMFSSILFQNETNTTHDLLETTKYVSPINLATIKLLSTSVVNQGDVPICPKHCYVVPINWIERIITYTISHPVNDSLQNIIMFLSPFFLVEKSDNSYSLLLDYSLDTWFNTDLLPVELMKKTLTDEEASEENLLKFFFLEEKNDSVVNPLIYWFVLFDNSYITINSQCYQYFNQFDLNLPSIYIKNQSSFLNYHDFCSDLKLIETFLSPNNKEIYFGPINLYLNKIYFSYSQMSLSSIYISNSLEMMDTHLLSIGFLFVCISIFVKLAVAPFHYWSLDVYEGSPNKTTVFFAIFPKIALFVLLTRFCYNSFYYIFINHYQIYFIILSVISIFIGSVGGLEQRKIKTLFAYSSLSHTGYILLSFSMGSVEGTYLMFYYLVLYMLSGMCFWAIYLFLILKKNYYSNKNNRELGDFVLLKEANPMLALILSVTLFSIAGIPPVVGFLAKIGIFLVVIKSSAYFIAVLGILLSVISTFYYIRFIKILYFDNSKIGKLYVPISTKKSLFISFLAILLILLCVNPTLLYLIIYKAVLLLNY